MILFVLLVASLTFPLTFADNAVWWDNAINLYPNSVTKWDDVREVWNNGTVALDVQVKFVSSSNVSMFKTYYLTGNGTTFVSIGNGLVTKAGDTKRLAPNEKLVFNIEASPINALTGGQTTSVSVSIQRTEVSGPPPSTPPNVPGKPVAIIAFNCSLNVQILPIFQQYYSADIAVMNPTSTDVVATINYWLSDANNSQIWNSTTSISIPANSTIQSSLDYPISSAGTYYANAQMIAPTQEQIFSRMFTVTYDTTTSLILTIVIFLLILGAMATIKKKKRKR